MTSEQERKDSNPLRRLWRPTALPGARSCFEFGVRNAECGSLALLLIEQFRIPHSALRIRKRPGGFEPPHPPWQGGRLPGYIMDAIRSQVSGIRSQKPTL